MSLGFSLLADGTMYKEVAGTAGYWKDGKWVPPSDNTYQPIVANWEPFGNGIQSQVLPTGVSSTDTITIFTNEDLATHNDLTGDKTTADIVYKNNPNENSLEQKYVVFDKAYWKKNSSNKLLSGHTEYIAIRKEKFDTSGAV
jgi:hypothetical protein